MSAKIIAVACVLWTSVLFGADKPQSSKFPTETTKSILVEGTWDWTIHSRAIGRFRSRVVKFEKRPTSWTISFVEIHRTGRHVRDKLGPTIQRNGPFPVTLKNGVLQVKRPEGTLIYTYRVNDQPRQLALDPEGKRSNTCRANDKLLQFPAVVRTNPRTFHFAYSELLRTGLMNKSVVRTWSQTWVCDTDPSKESKGKATITVVSPYVKKTSRVTYQVQNDGDRPSIVFRSTDTDKPRKDWIVWQRGDYGMQISKSEFLEVHLGDLHLQKTYSPVSDVIKKILKEKSDEPQGRGKRREARE